MPQHTEQGGSQFSFLQQNLGLPLDTIRSRIKKGYRQNLFRIHPDYNPSETANDDIADFIDQHRSLNGFVDSLERVGEIISEDHIYYVFGLVYPEFVLDRLDAIEKEEGEEDISELNPEQQYTQKVRAALNYERNRTLEEDILPAAYNDDSFKKRVRKKTKRVVNSSIQTAEYLGDFVENEIVSQALLGLTVDKITVIKDEEKSIVRSLADDMLPRGVAFIDFYLSNTEEGNV